MTPMPPYDCSVCGRPLVAIPGEGYAHMHPSDLDHIAVPVPHGEVRTVYRCDFCSADTPPGSGAYVLPAENFEAYGSGSVGDWQVCVDCLPWVQKKYWTKVASRAVIGGRKIGTPSMSRSDYVRLYKVLERHALGDPYPDRDL